IQFIKSSGVRRKGIIKQMTFPLKLAYTTLQSRSLLKKLNANLVIGFGGYVSGPICLAAAQINIPVIIHEQYAKIGLTNRI
ncbi:glycosyltransferase, partial [Francisella tularensis subsp. holarctica]|uniref:glycosyltransferase n=1 Tax=Francisella tularensis TaxID=263 RepID=UPI002381ABE4